MRKLSISTAAAALAMLGFSGYHAQAMMVDPQFRAPSTVANIACRVIREGVVRPFGPLIYRQREVCGGPFAMVDDDACVVRRERIVRPDGSVVFRPAHRCP